MYIKNNTLDTAWHKSLSGLQKILFTILNAKLTLATKRAINSVYIFDMKNMVGGGVNVCVLCLQFAALLLWGANSHSMNRWSLSISAVNCVQSWPTFLIFKQTFCSNAFLYQWIKDVYLKLIQFWYNQKFCLHIE